MNRLCVVFIFALSMQSISCKAQEYWSFRCTRALFEKGSDGKSYYGRGFHGYGSGSELIFTLALDIIMLPVTIPHDIWLYNNRDEVVNQEYIDAEFEEYLYPGRSK
jgi:hypothetical protein